jgi:MFS family permease
MSRISTKILFVSCLGIVTLGDLALASFAYVKTQAEDSSSLDDLGWLPLLFVTCIIAAQSVGCIPGIQLLLAEVFPSDIRPLSIGLTFATSMGMGAANVMLYPYMIDAMHFHGLFYFYAAITLVAFFWGIYTIPDNRGLSLSKVEENFAAKNKKKEVPTISSEVCGS